MTLLRLKLSTPGIQDLWFTTELFKLMLYIDIRKLNYLEIIHKTLNFWREIQIKDIHWRENNIS